MSKLPEEVKDSSRGGKDYLQDERVKIFLDHITGATDTEISKDLKRPRGKKFRDKRTETVIEETKNLAEVATSFLHTAAYLKMQKDHLDKTLKTMGIHVKPFEISDETMKLAVDTILEAYLEGEDWLNQY